jgi:hypothetical protein
MRYEVMMNCVEALVSVLMRRCPALLLTHLAWKSPIETSYADDLDAATMIGVEASM